MRRPARNFLVVCMFLEAFSFVLFWNPHGFQGQYVAFNGLEAVAVSAVWAVPLGLLIAGICRLILRRPFTRQLVMVGVGCGYLIHAFVLMPVSIYCHEDVLQIFRSLAAQDDATAKFNLGGAYREGKGVKQGDTEAVKRYRLAAAQGDATAQFNLGVAYHEGKGVKQDDTEAVGWFRLAAAQGNASAQHDLGVAYHEGKGVKQSDAEAVGWFRLAANQGYAWAQSALGEAYYEGIGVSQDYAEALKWYRLSAAQADAPAQNNLGVMYYMGRGVVQDYVRAYIWLYLSSASGYESGTKSLDLVADKMTSQQITEAQKMASECQQHNFKGCE